MFADFSRTEADKLKRKFMVAHTVLSEIRQDARRGNNVDEQTNIKKIEDLFDLLPSVSSCTHGSRGRAWEIKDEKRLVYQIFVPAAVSVLSEYAEIAKDLATLIQCVDRNDRRTSLSSTSRLFSLPEINFRLGIKQATSDTFLDQAVNRIRQHCAVIQTPGSCAHNNTCHFPAGQSLPRRFVCF